MSVCSNALDEKGSRGSAAEVFLAFLKLGCTSFGGPIAHLGYLREEFVERRRWLDDRSYADIVGLCQFTPGPASSKVGIALGLGRAGLPGAFAAWLGFTLPSALAMVLFGYGVVTFAADLNQGWLHGLKVVAVAVVAQAVWAMARNLCPDPQRFTLAACAALVAALWPNAFGQVAPIVAGGLIGALALHGKTDEQHSVLGIGLGKSAATLALLLFFGLLVALPAASALYPNQTLSLVDSFYRSGSLVFGGGHVVLPLLQSEVVPPGWVSNDVFLAGYGAAQAVPGPLFTFAAYLGTVLMVSPNGWAGGLICLLAIFASSFLLVIGTLPFWESLRHLRSMRAALLGVNAAVVGLLIAALYSPVWTSAIKSTTDFCLALAALTLLVFWKVPPWLVVLLTAVGGALLAAW